MCEVQVYWPLSCLIDDSELMIQLIIMYSHNLNTQFIIYTYFKVQILSSFLEIICIIKTKTIA